MSSAKTRGTELSVAFGILALSPGDIRSGQLQKCFDRTLSATNYRSYLREFKTNQAYYKQFELIRKNLRKSYHLFKTVKQLKWCGEEKQAITSSVSKDIEAVNVPISVKAESNVVHNSSPHNIFVSIPSGTAFATRTGNWYLLRDMEGFQRLYSFVRSKTSISLPADVAQFEKQATKEKRRQIQKVIRNFKLDDTAVFEKLYIQMCGEVAKNSADLFNNTLLNLPSSMQKSVMEVIVKHFFRLNNTFYLLCGLENSSAQFGLEIPDLTSWKKRWKVVSINAIPDLDRGQSVVNFKIIIEKLKKQTPLKFNFHTEIRWSHGKFCGSPEAKLYKEFSWSSVPFFKHII